VKKDWANEPSETAFARRVEEFVHGARLGGLSLFAEAGTCVPAIPELVVGR
jgi:hypothetical protein